MSASKNSQKKKLSKQNPFVGVGMVVFAAAIYILMFKSIYAVLGISITLFEFIVIAVGGWYFGAGVGFFAALLFTFTGTFLNKYFGNGFNWNETLLILIFEASLGIGTGWIASFQNKIKQQKDEALDALRLKDFAVASSISAIAISNLDGNITYVNDSFIKLWGHTDDQGIIGKPIIELWQHHDQGADMLATLIQKESWIGDFIGKKRDGALLNVQISAHIVKNKAGVPIAAMASFFDLTERKRAEKTLRENEEKLFRLKKMESLGLLAGGVAHDLNNVLSGIVSYPELLLLDLPEDSPLRKPIETIQKSGHNAAAIVQDLLIVARGVATVQKPLNLNDLIHDYLNSPEFNKIEQFHPEVTVKTDLDDELLNICGSRVHIRKVVMNLVSNAAEAIDGSGVVTVATANRYVDKPIRGYNDISVGEYAVLTVSDQGPGISSDDLKKIFEPFYTKKVMGRSGTGLGLAVVWNALQDHNGYIDVSTGQEGSSFHLFFPATRKEIADDDLPVALGEYQGDRERILVVDDVENQRNISCQMLERLGYQATPVESGEAAVEYLKENTADLLLLDMIMDPGINGRETYEGILKIHPRQKAIIVSGYSETDQVQLTQDMGAGEFIKKPFALKTLGMAIKKELAR